MTETASGRADYHPQCNGRAAGSLADVRGRFDYLWAEWEEVASCDLAAGHDGLCEAFVDCPQPESVGYWIIWKSGGKLATTYEWITGQSCDAASSNGYGCIRRAGHVNAGHAYDCLLG